MNLRSRSFFSGSGSCYPSRSSDIAKIHSQRYPARPLQPGKAMSPKEASGGSLSPSLGAGFRNDRSMRLSASVLEWFLLFSCGWCNLRPFYPANVEYVNAALGVKPEMRLSFFLANSPKCRRLITSSAGSKEQLMINLLLRLKSRFKEEMPTDKAALERFSNELLKTYSLPNAPDYHHAIATAIQQLTQSEFRCSRYAIYSFVKRAAAMRAAYHRLQDINKAEAEEKAKQAATLKTEPPLDGSQTPQKPHPTLVRGS